MLKKNMNVDIEKGLLFEIYYWKIINFDDITKKILKFITQIGHKFLLIPVKQLSLVAQGLEKQMVY